MKVRPEILIFVSDVRFALRHWAPLSYIEELTDRARSYMRVCTGEEKRLVTEAYRALIS